MQQQATMKPRMRRLGEGRYLVESSTTPGVGHQVDLGRGKCGCTAGRYGKACRHIALAQAADGSFQAWYSQARRPVTPRLSSTGTSGMAALMEAFG